MPKYRAHAHALNLIPGDEFESDDPYYVPFAEKGYIAVVPVEPVEAPADDESEPDPSELAEAPQSSPKPRTRRTRGGGSSGSTSRSSGSGFDSGD